MSSAADCTIVIDIGGTKIASGFIAVDAPTQVRGLRTRPTLAAHGREAVLSQLAAAVEESVELAESAGFVPSSVGVGAPGIIDSNLGEVTFSGDTMPGWAGTNIVSAVVSVVDLPVAVDNDVRAMGLGEAVFGAGRTYSEVAGADRGVTMNTPLIVFIAIGTGIGGAIVRGNEISRSSRGSRGEVWSLMCADLDGNAATIESVGSGPSMTASYVERVKAQPGQDQPPHDIDLRYVMERYRGGDHVAHHVISQSMTNVGRGLAGLVNTLDPDAIIIGGGVASIGEPILQPLVQGMREALFVTLRTIPIHTAELGTQAQLVGAGELGRRAFRDTAAPDSTALKSTAPDSNATNK